MPDDVSKVIGIDFKVTNKDGLEAIKKFKSSLQGLKTIVTNTVKKIDTIDVALKKIAFPPALTKIVSELEKISKIKAPDLSQLAKGFEKLKKIKTPPNLDKFVVELEKLNGIKLPNLGQIANGFAKIMNTPFGGFSKKIDTFHAGLTRLASINLDALSSTLQNLNKINLGKAGLELKKIEKNIQNTGKAAEKSGFQVRAFADKFRTVLQFRIVSGILQKINEAFTAGTAAIIEYDQALKDLQAITGATTLEVAQMGVKILEVASTTKFSAQEVAQGMRTIGQAGFSASEAVQTMQAVSDLATGTLSGMGTTVDLVTTAMRVFRIDALQSAEIADVFANAVNKSKLTIDKLRTAMNYVGPIARDSGVSFKELAASMGTLANSGLRASTIGTGLRRVFAELVDPSKKLREAVKSAGISMEDLNPRTNKLSSVLNNLGAVVNDASVAFDIFGKRGAAAVLALTSEDSKFEAMLATIGQSGTAANQAAIQMEGLAVSFKNMKDKAGLLAIALGESGIASAMKLLLDITRGLIDALTFLAGSAFGKVVVGLGLATTAVYALATAFGVLKLKAVFTSIITGITAMVSSFLAAETAAAGFLAVFNLTPIGLAITGIIVLLTSLVWWLNKTNEAAKEAAKLSDEYEILSKKAEDYAIKVSTLSDNSREFHEANRALRAGLFETAEGFEDLSTEALNAALSIDPLTGKIKDGSVALELYIQKLKEVDAQKLIDANEAINESFDSLKLPRQLLGFLDLAAKKTGSQFQDMKRYVVELDRKRGDLSKADKRIKQELKDLELQASKNLAKMAKLGNVNLKDTIKNFTDLAKAQGNTGSVLESMIDQFKELKELNADTPEGLIDIWAEKGADSLSKLYGQYGKLVEDFGEGRVAFTTGEKALVAKIENSKKELKVDKDKLLEETLLLLKNNKNKKMVWDRYAAIWIEIEERKDQTRKDIAKSDLAQTLVHLDKLNIAKKAALDLALIEYKDNAKKLALAQAQINKQYEIDTASVGKGTVDTDEQTKLYKRNLNEREAAHAKSLANIAELEKNKDISEEEAKERKLKAEFAFYARSFVLAREYRDKIKDKDDPDWEKRNKLVLDAEKRFYNEREKYLTEFGDMQEEARTTEIEGAQTVSEALYESLIKRRKEASKTLLKQLKADYEEGNKNFEDYYEEQRIIAEKAAKKDEKALTDRLEAVKGEHKKLADAINSSNEEKIRETELAKLIIELEEALFLINQRKLGQIANIDAAQGKANDRRQRKIDLILKAARAALDDAKLDAPNLSFEEDYRIEMEALKRFHKDKLDELVEQKDKELEIIELKKLQEEEIKQRKKNYEEDLEQEELKRKAKFFGDLASTGEDLMKAGIIQSAKAFKVFKAFSIVETIISTYASAQKAYDSLSKWPPLAIAAAAAAVASGLARVAMISKQQPPKAYAKGGFIEGSSPSRTADNIDIKATAGEYMQPVSAVRKYGTRVMNAIRDLSIPTDSLKALVAGTTWGLTTPVPSFALAAGGMVPRRDAPSSDSSYSINIPVNIQNVGDRMAKILPQEIEKTVIKVMRQELR